MKATLSIQGGRKKRAERRCLILASALLMNTIFYRSPMRLRDVAFFDDRFNDQLGIARGRFKIEDLHSDGKP